MIMENDIDNIWRELCDRFGIEYNDNLSLYLHLCDLIRSLNKSKYKDKKEKQWLGISVE